MFIAREAWKVSAHSCHSTDPILHTGFMGFRVTGFGGWGILPDCAFKVYWFFLSEGSKIDGSTLAQGFLLCRVEGLYKCIYTYVVS